MSSRFSNSIWMLKSVRMVAELQSGRCAWRVDMDTRYLWEKISRYLLPNAHIYIWMMNLCLCVQRTLLSRLHPPWRLDVHGRKAQERASWLVCHQTWACGWVHCWAHQKSLHVRHHPTQAFCCGLEAKTGRCALPFSSNWSQKGGDFFKSLYQFTIIL